MLSMKGCGFMAKILGSWSGMRKYLEKEMLAQSLKERVRYGCTSYVGMDGCHIFELCIDGEQIKRFSFETVNTYFIKKGLKDNTNQSGTRAYWDGFWPLLGKYSINERTEYTDNEFCDALADYREQDIKESICSDNPLVRMFALLDRRVGKRTLYSLKEDFAKQPEWLEKLYLLRCDAERICYQN